MTPGFLIVVPLLLALAVFGGGCLWALRREVQKAWLAVEAQIERRHDLIQRLVERQEGLALREPEAREALRNACGQAVTARGLLARAEAENQLSDVVHGLFAAADQRFSLEHSPSAPAARAELRAAEDRIAVARRTYNERVMAWNIRIARFPGSLISRPVGLQPIEYFVMDEPATERETPC